VWVSPPRYQAHDVPSRHDFPRWPVCDTTATCACADTREGAVDGEPSPAACSAHGGGRRTTHHRELPRGRRTTSPTGDLAAEAARGSRAIHATPCPHARGMRMGNTTSSRAVEQRWSRADRGVTDGEARKGSVDGGVKAKQVQARHLRVGTGIAVGPQRGPHQDPRRSDVTGLATTDGARVWGLLGRWRRGRLRTRREETGQCEFLRRVGHG